MKVPRIILMDPRYYGAKEDGVADDADAIQAALDAGGGFVRVGNSLIGKTLHIPDGVTIVGMPLPPASAEPRGPTYEP